MMKFLCTDDDAGDNFLAELLSSLTSVASSRALDNPTANDGKSCRAFSSRVVFV